MDPIIAFLSVLVILVIGAIILVLSLPSLPVQEPQKKIPGLDFIPTQMYRESNGMGGLAVNEETYQVCILKNAVTPPLLLPLGDLVGAVLLKNGEMVRERFRTRPKTMKHFVKTLQGRLQPFIASNAGSDSQGSNQRIDLMVAIQDEENPLHLINFLDMETKEGGILFEKALSTGKHWFYVLDNLLLKADHMEHLQGDIRDGESTAPIDPVAAEIEKLAELLDNELINEHEFKALKEKLLAGKS